MTRPLSAFAQDGRASRTRRTEETTPKDKDLELLRPLRREENKGDKSLVEHGDVKNGIVDFWKVTWNYENKGGSRCPL